MVIDMKILFVCLIVAFFLNLILCISAVYYNKLFAAYKKMEYKLVAVYGLFYYIKILNVNKKAIKSGEGSTASSKYDSLKYFSAILIYAICVVCFIVSLSLYVYNSKFTKTYYDLYQNEYKSYEDVIYYDVNQNRYKMLPDEFAFAELDNADSKISAGNCYIDKNGYFVIIEERLNIDNSLSENNPYCFYDRAGNYYADAITSSWNADGNLCETFSVNV